MEKKSSRAMKGPGKHPPSSPAPRRRRLMYLAPPLPALPPCSSRAAFAAFSFGDQLESPHFLDACALCRSPLERARDIFMYRGDTPYCSEDCRREQIELDEAREEEEKAGYWRSRRRRRPRRAGEPPADPPEVQGVIAPASGTAVAG